MSFFTILYYTHAHARACIRTCAHAYIYSAPQNQQKQPNPAGFSRQFKSVRNYQKSVLKNVRKNSKNLLDKSCKQMLKCSSYCPKTQPVFCALSTNILCVVCRKNFWLCANGLSCIKCLFRQRFFFDFIDNISKG